MGKRYFEKVAERVLNSNLITTLTTETELIEMVRESIRFEMTPKEIRELFNFENDFLRDVITTIHRTIRG